MEAPIVTQKLYVETLTPVFIGSNEKVQPYEYLVHNGRFYRLNLDAIARIILEADSRALDLFASWLEESTQGEARGGALRKHPPRGSQQQPPIIAFVSEKLRDQQLARTIREGVISGKLALYSLPWWDPEQGAHAAGRSQQHRQMGTILAAIKTGSQKMYIPGSSLKGVLRTALLYTVLTEADEGFLQRVAAELEQSMKGGQRDRVGKALERLVFFYGQGAEREDAKYDLMKFIGVSDSTEVEPKEGGKVVLVEHYKTNGKARQPGSIVEAIAARQVFSVCIRVDMGLIHQMRQWGEKGLGMLEYQDTLEERFKRLYGCSLHEAKAEHVFKRLLDAANKFGRAVAERDRQWAGSRYPDLAKLCQHLPEGAVKLGWGSGFHATTVSCAVLEREELQKLLRAYLRNRHHIQVEQIPTSRRMWSSKQGSAETILPLGWVRLSFDPLREEQRIANTGQSVNIEQSSVSLPSEPPIAERLRNGAEVCARIVDSSKQPITVELLVRRYEGQYYPCRGVSNTAGLSAGTIVRVRVNLQGNRIQSLTYLGIWKQ